MYIGRDVHGNASISRRGKLAGRRVKSAHVNYYQNEQEQLACIIEVLGLPDKYLVDRSSRRKLFFGKLTISSSKGNLIPGIDSTGAPRPVVNSKGRRRKPASKTLAQVIKSDDEQFLDFISKCLIYDPDRR